MSQRLLMKRLLTFASHRSRFGTALFQYNKNCISHTVRNFNNKNVNNFNKAVIPQQPVDLLMQNIRLASDTCDVLYNVQQHHAIMNDMHVMQALQTIFLLQKSQQSTVTNSELINHSSFLLLCKTLQQKIRFLELNDHLNALKVLSFVGVASNYKTVQILLQLLSKRVNDLSLQQIVFLDFMLKDFDSCPLVDALKMALPIVFEVRFKYESNTTDVKQLMELFIYAVKKRLSDECIDLFANKLNENKNNIDVETSKVIVRTLCEAKRSETPFRNLLHLSLDNIVDNVDRFSFLDLNYILARLSSNFNKKSGNHFYHEEFLNTVANYVVDRNCDAEQATWVLKSCNKFKHTHKGIVDYICEKVSENPSGLDKWSLGMLVTLINALSLLDYRPDNFSLFQENIINNLLKFSYKMELPWLRVALDLCSLDCWPLDLFNLILEEEFLNRFLKRGNAEDIFELIQLYQAIVTLCPSYQGNLPSPACISEAMEKIRKLEDRDRERSQLLPALTHGLGGPSYVFSPAYTKLGHFIDHAIVMRKGGYPISINNSSSVDNEPIIIEDLQLPEDSQIILVLFLTPKYYTVNTERIPGHIRLNINTLEAMGFSVVSVLESTWENLLDGERIPYIMQALQNKCQDLENVAASHT